MMNLYEVVMETKGGELKKDTYVCTSNKTLRKTLGEDVTVLKMEEITDKNPIDVAELDNDLKGLGWGVNERKMICGCVCALAKIM